MNTRSISVPISEDKEEKTKIVWPAQPWPPLHWRLRAFAWEPTKPVEIVVAAGVVPLPIRWRG